MVPEVCQCQSTAAGGHKLKEKKGSEVSKSQLEIINDQYHNFIAKRESIISLLNDNNRHAIACIKEMEISEINVMLSTLFVSTKILNLKCEICTRCANI